MKPRGVIVILSKFESCEKVSCGDKTLLFYSS